MLWLVALKTQYTRRTWQEIAPVVSRYAATPALHDMHRDAVLTGVRKLVERTGTSRSMFQVLHDIARVEITADDLMARHGPHEWLSDTELREDIQRNLYALNEGIAGMSDELVILEDDLARLGERLIAERVRAMAEELDGRHRHVVQWCNEEVTHLPSTRTAETPSWDEIEAVIADVLALARQWVGALDRADLRTEEVSPQTRDLTRALELFDWQRYIEAVAERHRQVFDHHRQAPSFAEVERGVAVEFVWPEPKG